MAYVCGYIIEEQKQIAVGALNKYFIVKEKGIAKLSLKLIKHPHSKS